MQINIKIGYFIYLFKQFLQIAFDDLSKQVKNISKQSSKETFVAPSVKQKSQANQIEAQKRQKYQKLCKIELRVIMKQKNFAQLRFSPLQQKINRLKKGGKEFKQRLEFKRSPNDATSDLPL
ncbi:hypothetical protein TTHERM_00426000 (macronuclear) [Tetrahymena thermophila SB210]|uniref:Uncharacterized protein n=1 Tax=Tetrahymena thermophila (strain SB210) TaxID=312017 RepID=Q23AF9_TETTS|nr:hypothetical protein TTHERM_00426000 [Tetrahymena thermophila SB210]EAR93533.1 hypothetical protein TTHERM_00426000 [Tetrahymena thermophila SB210]|eukprot:XP_001013778.1 hypothetical protein TTHERM_00426000 [Tetrahymena thermophila SB210]